MTQPDMTTVGADLYDAVAPLATEDEAQDWALANFMSALGLLLEDVALLVRTDDDGNDGWTAFASPDRCPDSFLFTLAVWAGVRYPRRMSTDDLRALIGPHAPGLWRGTKGAITAAVARYLTPEGKIFFEERADGDAYHIRIFTYEAETLDEPSLRRELLAAIPAGLILDYEVRIGQTYGQLKAAVATYGDMKARWATYRDVLYEPSPGAEDA